MINNNYLNGLASLMASESYTVVSHLAFGSTTGTLTATDTVTSGEFDRNAISSKAATGNTVKYIGSRDSTEAGNEYINVTSFVNSSTVSGSNDIQTNMLVSSLLHTSDFTVEIETWIKHVRA